VWLHLPSACCPSVPVTAGLTSPLPMQFEELARSVTSRGKLRPSRYWRSAWKRGVWMRLLSGVTSPPSTLEHGAVQWISSVRDSRVSPSASPANDSHRMTLDGSGLSSSGSPSTAERPSYSLRTSQASLLPDWEVSSKDWPRAGFMLSGLVIPHPRSVRPTVETAGSAWPTPDAGVSTRSNQSDSDGAAVRPNLALIAKMWPTATVADSQGHQYSRDRGDADSPRITLAGYGSMWMTPTVRDYEDGACADQENVPTNGLLGRQAVRTWPTITASDATKMSGEGTSRQGGPSLTTAGLRGPTGSPSGMVLNPLFVEALMGLPAGWTDCGCWETALSGSKPRTPSAISSQEPEAA
jgi:hypothetical protein